MIEFRNFTVLQKEGKCYGNCMGGEADDVLRARSINSTTSRYLFTIHRIISRLHIARLLTSISPATAATNARISDRLCSYDSRIEATSVCRTTTKCYTVAPRGAPLDNANCDCNDARGTCGVASRDKNTITSRRWAARLDDASGRRVSASGRADCCGPMRATVPQRRRLRTHCYVGLTADLHHWLHARDGVLPQRWGDQHVASSVPGCRVATLGKLFTPIDAQSLRQLMES